MATYQLTKLQAIQYAEGYNLAVACHNEGRNDGGKSPKGAWIKCGYEDVRSQVLARQMTKGATMEFIMAPFDSITPETAQQAWDAADARTKAAMAAWKARTNTVTQERY